VKTRKSNLTVGMVQNVVSKIRSSCSDLGCQFASAVAHPGGTYSSRDAADVSNVT
jgi:hypothetical protein